MKKIPQKVQALIDRREELREEKRFKESDSIRDENEKLGYKLQISINIQILLI